jgi:hypothetical protein
MTCYLFFLYKSFVTVEQPEQINSLSSLFFKLKASYIDGTPEKKHNKDTSYTQYLAINKQIVKNYYIHFYSHNFIFYS